MRPAHEIALFGGSGGVTRDCAERVDLAEWISIRKPCYNVIVESREGNYMTLRGYHDL